MGQMPSSRAAKALVPPASTMLLFAQPLPGSRQAGQTSFHQPREGWLSFPLPQPLPGCSLLEAEMGTGYFSADLHGASASWGRGRPGSTAALCREGSSGQVPLIVSPGELLLQPRGKVSRANVAKQAGDSAWMSLLGREGQAEWEPGGKGCPDCSQKWDSSPTAALPREGALPGPSPNYLSPCSGILPCKQPAAFWGSESSPCRQKQVPAAITTDQREGWELEPTIPSAPTKRGIKLTY